MLKNNFEYWTIQLSLKRGKMLSKREMAKFLGVEHTQFSRLINSRRVPEQAEYMYRVWERLRTEFPEINLQDLFVQAPG